MNGGLPSCSDLGVCVCLLVGVGGVNTGFPEHVGVVLSSYQLIRACNQVPLYLSLPVAAPLRDAEGLAGPLRPPPVHGQPSVLEALAISLSGEDVERIK